MVEIITKKSHAKKIVKVVFVILVLFVTAVSSFIVGNWYSVEKQAQNTKAHPLLAKRLFIENPNDTISNFEPLRSQLRKELEYYNGKSSLYFEYLPTGTSIRTGETSQFIGASLLKLPYVMDLYHLAESKKVNLDEQIMLKQEWLGDQFGDLYKKGSGYSLTIREAASLALEHSDNTAVNAVRSVIADHHLSPSDSSFNALDINYSSIGDNIELSAWTYSSFLKCLYFTCYLNKDNSQEILSYLSHSTVGEDRLPKYLPKGLTVAHKIGVVGEAVQNDCGIVYVPKRNYIFCVMIQESKDKGSEVIAQLSKYVYDYITQAP